MLRPAARLRALAGALCCALILCAAMATPARADDRPMAYAPAVEGVGSRPAYVAIRNGLARPHSRALAGVSSRPPHPWRGMLAGVSTPLRALAGRLSRECGAVVVSGRRHTRVAGSGRLSLHASGRAMDVRGDYRCIYARLRGWPGGVSTDAGAVRHIHISLGGREDGRRFTHHRSTRLAARRHHRASEG